ncbi:hypothetical protein NHX12_006994 [Muraenolepis orangiensis]|uniref:Cilia- and flagella-associated protein 91 n=1 Tax=Muraenolepis orangiensis TaxID=630683 RepID=A0A9Q0DP23_9TELE|nr:hypothetical protein NHX12_006994 [Muraenolepis orangiensis]
MNVSVTRKSSNKRTQSSTNGFRPQRVYDYLYDPVHTVSGEADHAKSGRRAYASVERLRKVPEFKSMFSSLPHHPRYGLQFSTVDPVPASIDRRWRGHAEQRSVLPGTQPGVREQPCDVTAADRWKFFTRPDIPFAHHLPPEVLFAPLTLSSPTSGGDEQAPPGSHRRTVGVQTDYRDGECQTDPYSPEYVVRPGTPQPELLTLASLTWGRGLPAGLAEVEMIERARVKQAWEASLPPLDDLSQLEKRRRMMEAMDTVEWAFREEEIHKLQEARLAALRDLLSQRDRAQAHTTAQRLDHNMARHQRDKDTKLSKIRRDYDRSLRKLTAKRRSVEGRLERRDVVRDHTDHSSQTYAPLARGGSVPDRSLTAGAVKSRFLDTYEGLLELEASLPASVLEPKIKAPKPKATKRFVSRSEHIDVVLMKAHQALKEEKDHVEQQKPLRFLVKKEKPAPMRPPTPRVHGPPEGEEEKEMAIIHLQKLLRGRSIQYQMFKGKERCVDLIRELRTTHALLQEDEELLQAQTDLILSQKHQRDLNRHQAAEEQAHRDGLVGAELADLLDTLSKELIRLQEERRIHAVVVTVHQASVALYLEDIVLASVEQTAELQAREEVRRIAREVNHIAYAMEESLNELQSEEIVSELVYSFLIPEVQKISVRQKVRDRQRRHLQAAQRIIHGSVDSSGVSLGPARVQSPGSGSEGTPARPTEDESHS